DDRGSGSFCETRLCEDSLLIDVRVVSPAIHFLQYVTESINLITLLINAIDPRPPLRCIQDDPFFIHRKTETMNGNSRRKSETESSSSLESRDPLRISSSSDSLRRYTYLPTPSYAHTHKKALYFV
ncbi:unnamed protein product, partial [Brassica napus]